MKYFRASSLNFKKVNERIKDWILKLCFRVIALLDARATPAPFDLTPTDCADNVKPYLDQLSGLIENRSDRVYEIAITGPYSSGKTSLLKTFERLNPKHKYTWISLATFEAPKKDPDQDSESAKTTVHSLEKSIVQQLLYRSKSDSVSSSRFRRIYTRPMKLWFSSTILIWFVVLGFLHSTEILSWETFLVPADQVELWMMVFASAVALLLLQDGMRAIRRFDISKLSFYNVELAFGGNDDSVFNEYLEEILYHFKANNTDIVIFEDLDRFPGNEIFIRLKELNTIINHSADVERPVRFVYAVQDDLFNHAERVKFFDAIIPLIPVANESNAYPIFKELLEQAGLADEFDDNMLRGVMIYIDDMRVLKNIVNEFMLYRSILSQYMAIDSRIKNQLMCFMIYKNCYCDDFAKLHKSEGLLVDIFKAADHLRDTIKESLYKDVESLGDTLKNAENDELRSVEELNMVFCFAILKRYSDSGVHGITKISNVDVYQLEKQDNFNWLMALGRIDIHTTGNGQRRNQQNPFSELSQKDCEYQRRLLQIENKQREKQEEIKQKIQRLNDKSAVVLSLPIDALCKQYSERWNENIGSLLDVREARLLRVLVENSYLDEQYHKFIAIFKPGHITAKDHKFILSVNNGEPLEASYPLDDAEAVFDYLKGNSRLHNRALLNFSLIDYLLQKNESTPLRTMLKSMRMEPSVAAIFWDAVNHLESVGSWLHLLARTVDSYWSLLIHAGVPNSKKYDLLISSLLQVQSDEIDSVLTEADRFTLKSYLDEEVEVLNVLHSKELERDHVYGLFESLDIRFITLEKIESVDCVASVFDRDLFLLSPKNLMTISNARNDINSELPLDYDFLRSDTMIGEVVEANMGVVASWVLVGDMFVGSSEGWLTFLNDSAITDEMKSELVGLAGFGIDVIQNVQSKFLWKAIINGRKMSCDWKNIVSCLTAEEDQLDTDILAEYLNDQATVRTLVKLPTDSLDNDDREIFRRFILSDSIQVDPFKSYDRYLNQYTHKDDIPTISTEKLEYLISVNGFEGIDMELFAKLYERGASLGLTLIEKYSENYLSQENIPEIKADVVLLSLIDKSSKLDKEDKKRLFETSGSVAELVINAKSLPAIMTPNKPYSTNELMPNLPTPEFESVLNSNVPDDVKLLLMIGQMQYFDLEQALAYLCQIDEQYAVLEKEGDRLKRDYSEVEHRLAEALKVNEYIKDFEISGDGTFSLKKKEVVYFSQG